MFITEVGVNPDHHGGVCLAEPARQRLEVDARLDCPRDKCLARLAVFNKGPLTPGMAKTLLTFVDEIYEDLELWYPLLRLQEAGYSMRLAAPELRTYAGKHGYPATSDLLLQEARSEDFCGLLIPGGFMPDKLRRDAKVLALTREFFRSGKLVAFICHGGWIPISAKILHGKRVTGSLGIKDDLENAGGVWVNQPVVVDGNLISSRTPRDLAPFAKAMVDFLQSRTGLTYPTNEAAGNGQS